MRLGRRRRVVVVGGGGAGLAAARTAAAAGARTTLVSAGPLGGDCTWTGCVPSKALLERTALGEGWERARTHLLDVRARIAATEDATALARDDVATLAGTARLLTGEAGEGAPALSVLGEDGERTRLDADGVVWATGSAPLVPDVPGLDAVPYLTNETVFDLPAAPGSVLVLGGGAIGCELATVLARCGSRVQLVESAPRLLAKEEPDASRVVEAALRVLGVDVRTGARLVRVEATADGARAHLAGGPGAGVVEVERVLVATGRRPVVGDGADEPGHARLPRGDRGEVVTDERLRTRVTGVWAAGDCTGRLPFTHAADAMGRVAGANAARGWSRGRARYEERTTPWVTFTDPEVARVGLSEAQAAAAVRGARVAHLPHDEVDRALTAGRSDGFVTLVTGPRRVLGHLGGGRLLGATVVGPRAGETIAEVVLAMRVDCFTGRLAQATHAYPTWGTAVQVAAAQTVGTFGGRRSRPARAEP
ncbi:dihydrolipoyl dehydrogenase family protein [Aquipuribacter sp. SD81]|uniref:dihydrolipoyl dehydrogenase family protein n=1 Tax=Aquipuribacter sp. SD81 TaxID=3127703 RepID=UPI003017813F